MSGISSLIGALRVSLGLDSAEFEEGSRRARERARRDADELQNIYYRAGVKIGSALKTAFAFGSVAAAGIGVLVKQGLDYASSLGEVAQQLGVTTRDLQVYRYAATQVGISQEEMDKGLAKLTLTIGKAAAGQKAQATTFRELGVSVTDANGHLLTAGQVIPRLADALSKIQDPATRARIEVELFGKTGQTLDTLLAGGSGAINELAAAADKLGIILSDEQIQSADRTADKLSELNTALSANIAGIVADNADAIFRLADAIERAAVAAAKFSMDALDAWRVDFLTNQAEGAEHARDTWNPLVTREERLRAAQLASDKRGEIADIMKRRDLVEQRALGNDMLRTMGIDPSTPPRGLASGALPTVDDHGAGARSAAAAAAKAAREARQQAQADARYNDDLAGLRADLLAAFADESGSAEDRARAARAHLEAEQKQFNDQTNLQEHLSEAQRATLIAANDELTAQKSHLIDIERERGLAKEKFDRETQGNRNYQDLIRSELGLARTAEERRKGGERLLELQYSQERADQELIKATNAIGSAAYQNAEARLAILDQLHAADSEKNRRDNLSPGAAYRDSLNLTAAQMHENLESTGVHALERINQGFDDSIKKTLKLHGILGDIAGAFIDMAVKQALIRPLANILFPGGQSGGGGGIFGSLLSGLGGLLGLAGGPQSSFAGIGGQGSGSLVESLPASSTIPGYGGLPSYATGLATGGTITGFPGIDRNVLSLNGDPIARVGMGEQLRIEPNNDNGGWGREPAQVHIIPSPYFDVVVDQRAAGVAVPLSVRAAGAGSTGAQVALARQAGRRIP